MLLTGILLPEIYRQLPSDTEHPIAYYANLIGLMRELLINCVLLVESADGYGEAIDRATDSWPSPYGEKARYIAQALKHAHRMCEAQTQASSQSSVVNSECTRYLAIAAREDVDFVFRPWQCDHCEVLAEVKVEANASNEYQVSPFAEDRLDAERVELSHDGCSVNEFERRILRPLFRHTTHVRIFDRMIGRFMVANSRTSDRPALSDNYRQTLTWIYRVFADVAASRVGAFFEVTCGLYKKKETHLPAYAAALDEFARQLTNECGVPVQMVVKRETQTQQMRHARFLFTDQIGIQIDRGFDMLTANNKMHDVMITLVKDPERIAREAGILKNVVRSNPADAYPY